MDFDSVVLCVVCRLSMSSKPALLRCGHSICRPCHDIYYTRAFQNPIQLCPMCRQAIDFNYEKNENYAYMKLYEFAEGQERRHQQQLQEVTLQLQQEIERLQQKLNNTRGYNSQWRPADIEARDKLDQERTAIAEARAKLDHDRSALSEAWKKLDHDRSALSEARAKLDHDRSTLSEEKMVLGRERSAAVVIEERNQFEERVWNEAKEWVKEKERRMKLDADNFIKRAIDRYKNACHKCGAFGHWKRECKNGIRCLNCHQSGHLASDCTEERQLCLKCRHYGHYAEDCGR